MSLSFLKRNKRIPKIFNPKDFQVISVNANNIEVDELVGAKISSVDYKLIDNTGSNTDEMASKNYVDTKISDLIGGASGAYDSLKELENELKDNDNAITSILNTLNQRATTTALASTNSSLETANTNLTNLTTRMENVEFLNDSQSSFINQLWNNKQDKSDMVNFYNKSESDNLLNGKQDKSDMTNYYNKTESNNLLSGKADNSALNSYYTKTESNNLLSGKVDNSTLNNYYTKTQNDTLLNNKANTSDLTSATGRISSLETKSTAISFNPTLNRTMIDNVGIDTLVIGSNTQFSGSVSGLTKNMVGLSNVDNVSDQNKIISNATQTALNLKQDRSNSLYSNCWYVNAGVNNIGSVLTSIGTTQAQNIFLSAGVINDLTNGITLTQTNTTLSGVDSAFSSPSTLISGNFTIDGSTTTRIRVSNIGFNNNVVINGGQGRHNFKGCVFSSNFSITGSTNNWINFHYCSFSGQVNIPSTLVGYIIFYFCDFSGATLNFNNLSNQQIYINSCINLPSFSLNALYNGFNTTITSSKIDTVSLNCSGSVNLVDGSINKSSVNGLVSDLSTINSNISTLQTDNTDNKSRLTTLETDNTSNKSRLTTLESDNTTNKSNIISLQTNKSDITYVDGKITTLKSEILGGASSAYDTLVEIQQFLENDATQIQGLLSTVSQKANSSDLTTTNNNLSSLSTNLSTNYYNKNNTDTLLSGKVDNATLNNYYTKTQNDSLLSDKVNNSTLTSYYTKTENDTLLNTKQDKSEMSNYFTKTQADNKFALQSDLTTSNQNISSNSNSINTINSNFDNYYTKTHLDTNFQTKLTFDSVPTSNSQNIVRSGSVFSALQSYLTTSTASSTYLTQSNATSTYQPLLTFDTSPTSGSSNIVRSGGIFTALQSYLTTSTASSTYLTQSNATSTYQPLLTFDSAPTSGSSNSVRSGGIFTALQSYLTQTAGDARYQLSSGMTSFFNLSSNNTISGSNTFNNVQTVERICEQITQSGSGTNLSLNYTNIRGIIIYAPSANFTFTLTNLPTSNTNCIYTLTFVYSTKFFANAISINGTSYTMTAIGGLANISINASASRVYQQIQIIFNNSSTPSVSTSVLSLW
jgi:hypothetical protein